MSARVDYIITRLKPGTPEGRHYFTGTASLQASRSGKVIIPDWSMFRTAAGTFDEMGATLLAGILNAFSPAAGVPGIEPWRAHPAEA